MEAMKIILIVLFASFSMGASATAKKSVKKATSIPTKPAFLTLASGANELVMPIPIPVGKTTHSCRPNRTVSADATFKDLCGRSLQVQKVAKPGTAIEDFKAAGLTPQSGGITSQSMSWGKLFTAREPSKGGKILYRLEVKDNGPVFMLKDTHYHKIEFAKFQLTARKPAAVSKRRGY